MPTYALQQGVSTQITQNVPYSLPVRSCYVFSSAAIDQSADGTTWAAFTGANTVGAIASGQYIRCTTASPTVIAKVY